MTKAIILSDGSECLVDDADYEWLSAMRWHPRRTRHACYAQRNAFVEGKRKTVSMHQLILVPRPGFVTDHIDHDGLNNQRSNLRYATRSQNALNTRLSAATTTGILGVTPYKDKFRAQITVERMTHLLGTFDTIGEAKAARDAAAKKNHGEFYRS